MKWITFLTIVGLLFLGAETGGCWIESTHHTYLVTTADEITTTWNAAPGYSASLHDYVIQGYNHERQITVQLGTTDLTQFAIRCPKTGHWIIEVFVLRVSDGQRSPAASSIDGTATVDGTNKTWWIHAWVAPTGPIEHLGGEY